MIVLKKTNPEKETVSMGVGGGYCITERITVHPPSYSQTKWSVPLKIALMNWLFQTWTR